MKYLRWIWRGMEGIRWNTLIRVVAGIVQVGLGLLMVWLCRRFIDVTIHTGTPRDVSLMILWLVLTVMGGVILRQLYYYMSITALTRQTNSIRLTAFNRLFDRQLYADRDLHSGDVSSRLSKDIDMVGEATTSLLPRAFVTIVQLVGAFLLMHSMDRRLAWALLVLTPLAILFGKVIARPLRKMTLEIRDKESHIQMQVQEGVEHNAVLRSLGSEQWVSDRLDETQDALMGWVKKRARFTVVTRTVLASCFGLGYLLAFVWGGLQLRAGAITFGVMTSFLQLVSQIQNPILTLLNMVPQLIQATASIDRLDEILQQEPEKSTDTALDPAKDRIVGVRVEDVSFCYATGDYPIFSHFTHDFRPGSKTALMGPTGVGKTTLFRLMLALIKPDAGHLTIYDETGETPVSPDTRSAFVFVPQGNTLLSGSVRFNLLLARPTATDEELREVLHTAAADFVFNLPDGLDTELGERGIGLSEGQAQRIAIARGLLRPGSILLLDEISASLDEATERELYTRLFAACPDRTMLFITHRPTVSELCSETLHVGRNTNYTL
ncbi:MAG: ABC transporter ATP-binding protein [Bacteroidales bacterium]|nr:ABC transporter ATP-binding protein [Bacteroidales bacterium]